MKLIQVVSSVALATFLAACGSTPPKINVSIPEATTIGGVEVELTGILTNEDGSFAGCAGMAVNYSGESLMSCTVTFDLFDEAGNKIGTSQARTQQFRAGQAWKFDVRPNRRLAPDVTFVEVASIMAVTESGRALSSLDSKVDLPPTSLVDTLRVDVTDYMVGGPGLGYVRGQATNEGKTDLERCVLHFDLFSKSGGKVGTAQVTLESFGRDETVEFQAEAVLSGDDHVQRIRVGRVEFL